MEGPKLSERLRPGSHLRAMEPNIRNHDKGSPCPPGDFSLEGLQIPEIPGRKEGTVVDVNGAKIYYETFGEGLPLMLIHGGAATIESWFCQIPALAEKHLVVVPEARGHGRSPDVEGEIDFVRMADDFAGLLDHLGLRDVGLIGWSDGGVTALQMAMDRPDLVSKIVALGTHSRPEGMTEAFTAEIEGATPELFPEILVSGYKALSPDGPDHWPVVFGKLRTMWLTLPDFGDEELGSVKCPVLLLNGETDIVRPEETERMEELIPNARRLVLRGATHYAPVEMPAVVNAAILEFLES